MIDGLMMQIWLAQRETNRTTLGGALLSMVMFIYYDAHTVNML